MSGAAMPHFIALTLISCATLMFPAVFTMQAAVPVRSKQLHPPSFLGMTALIAGDHSGQVFGAGAVLTRLADIFGFSACGPCGSFPFYTARLGNGGFFNSYDLISFTCFPKIANVFEILGVGASFLLEDGVNDVVVLGRSDVAEPGNSWLMALDAKRCESSQFASVFHPEPC